MQVLPAADVGYNAGGEEPPSIPALECGRRLQAGFSTKARGILTRRDGFPVLSVWRCRQTRVRVKRPGHDKGNGRGEGYSGEPNSSSFWQALDENQVSPNAFTSPESTKKSKRKRERENLQYSFYTS